MVIKVIAIPDDICIISQVRHFVKCFCKSFLRKFSEGLEEGRAAAPCAYVYVCAYVCVHPRIRTGTHRHTTTATLLTHPKKGR